MIVSMGLLGRWSLLLLVTMLGACSALPHGSGLPAPFSRSLALSGIPTAAAALDIRTVEGKVLASHNQQLAFNPASVMKLVTTAAALDLLGPDYRWITRVYAQGPLVADVLNGDLIIQGSGDPRLAHEDLARLLRRLRSLGVREIQGDLVLDRSLFQTTLDDAAAFDGLPYRAYNALPDALLLDAKAISLRFFPDAQTQSVRVAMEPPMVDFLIEPPKLDTEPCINWREKLGTVVDPSSVHFSGTYSVDCGERVLVLHAHTLSHARYFDAVFRQLWRELGGSIVGVMREEKKLDSARELLQWESPTLAQIIRDINKHSNNVMARQLLISLATLPTSTAVTPEVGAAQAKAWLDTLGVNSESVVIENGAGLSRKERLSANALSKVLYHAWHSPYMPEFIASLPIVGVDGTMIRTLKNSAVKARAHIKTGSLNDVASIAGYVKAKSGRWISVVCMINHAEANSARTSFNELLEWIYEHY
ncbi:MAG: D-alanyl-D-alanine carboxypeptidase/D-alanyl-D-alanine-endopeptidase [Sulfuritalea sp.]|nr:D-alanyl-D-alanine carboxypeptidase/D-alanyl-D-alanine-endopeptidase [Polynucleobacter sp.]MCF8188949.1 D-alanyl-D-alanine carboxypeptidase/D-alanyl-D-alanine-endopeptidase [Sulfuritalea sp.]